MSGILRNTLHLVGTAKYATNNSTKYLRSMTLTASRFHSKPNYFNSNESGFQVEQTLTNFWTIIRAAGKKILSPFQKDLIRTSCFSIFEVSLSNSNTRIITAKKKKTLILPPSFRTVLNETPFIPQSNQNLSGEDEKELFKLGKWNATLWGDEVEFTSNDTDKAFILSHRVHVKALIHRPKAQEDGFFESTSPEFDSQIITSSAKIISQFPQSKFLVREFPPPSNIMLESSTEESEEEITDRPNSFGQTKLQFPMNVILEGAPQIIKIKDSVNTLTAYHVVNIQAVYAKKSKITNSNRKKHETSDIGILRMTVDSGDIKIRMAESPEQMIIIRQKVDVAIDLDSEIPSISVRPHIKNVVSVD